MTRVDSARMRTADEGTLREGALIGVVRYDDRGEGEMG